MLFVFFNENEISSFPDCFNEMYNSLFLSRSLSRYTTILYRRMHVRLAQFYDGKRALEVDGTFNKGVGVC